MVSLKAWPKWNNSYSTWTINCLPPQNMQTYVNFEGTSAFHNWLITRSCLTVTVELEFKKNRNNNKQENINEKLIRRWDSERELSLRRHCTRTKNTIDSCINCATDRFLQRKFTKFSEMTQYNRHYAVQGHSRSPILVPIESSYTTSY